VVETAKRILKAEGYHVEDGVLAADRLGAPQLRRRHFMIAARHSLSEITDLPTYLGSEPMTVGQAIGDLEELHASFLDDPAVLSEINRQRIDYLFEEDLYNLPDNIRPKSHQNGHTYPSVYGRLEWDKPAPTITTGFMTPGRGRFIHPRRRRTLTAHEAARLQGFPDSFSFELPKGEIPSKKLLSKWIGDAVPMHLGYAAGIFALNGLETLRQTWRATSNPTPTTSDTDESE
jgi:DNA (cytosine-5)-methyltransferase 1